MNEALTIGLVVLALSGVLGLGVSWRKFSGASETRKIEPSPLVVQAAERHPTMEHCEKTCLDLGRRIDAVERRTNNDQALIRAELTKLREGNDALQRRLNGMSTTVYMIAGKMGLFPRMPEEVDG